jgi:mutual gliding-motility protein MglA
MSFINEETKEINCKILYCGPLSAGKSTTLKYIYGEAAKGIGGKSLSLNQGNDNALFFDFVPLNIGKVGGYDIRIHLYTIPREDGYDQAKQMISTGVDGVVFVADSKLDRMDENINSLKEVRKLLKSVGDDPDTIPFVFQYNKRDLSGTVPTDELNRYLNDRGAGEFESIATKGQGVMDAFRAVSANVLRELKSSSL